MRKQNHQSSQKNQKIFHNKSLNSRDKVRRTFLDSYYQKFFRERPVDILTFVSDAYYLGRSTSNGQFIYPIWKDALVKMFDDMSKTLIVLSGAIGCLGPDVKVKLLDGRHLTIPEIIKERKRGVQHWVYSYDIKSHKVVPGKVVAALLSGRNVNVIEVCLDNKQKIKCTPDHPFLLRTGEYVRADMLKRGMRLMPLYLDETKNGYEVCGSIRGKWKCTFKQVDEYFNGKSKKNYCVHHIDLNKKNNNPDNLRRMSVDKHFKLHQKFGHWSIFPEMAVEAGKKGLKTQWSGVLAKENRKRRGEFFSNVLRSGMGAELSNRRWSKPGSKQRASVILTRRMNEGLASKLSKKRWARRGARKRHKNVMHDYWINRFPIENRSCLYCSKNFKVKCFSKRKFCIAPHAWMYGRCKKNKNHKVISIKRVKNVDVYDLSIENHHNFALSAGVFVHNTGKTNVALWAICYLIYFVECMLDPWEFMKITNPGKFAVSFFNLNKTLGDSNGYSRWQSLMLNSPWFRKNAMHVHEGKSQYVELKRFEPVISSPNCLSGDTKISLLDGRELEIVNVIKEVKSGKKLYVYSYDFNKKRIYAGKIIGGGKTGNWCKTYLITLDNGKIIQCTSNHKFILRSGKYKEARDLKVGQSLMPLYRKISDHGYEQFFSLNSNEWRFTHRRMSGGVPKKHRDKKGRYVSGIIVHHKDFNKRNNNPNNLKHMTHHEHRNYHAYGAQNNVVRYARSDANRKRASIFLKKLNVNSLFIKNNKKTWTNKRRKEQAERMRKVCKLNIGRIMSDETKLRMKESSRHFWDSSRSLKHKEKKRKQFVKMNKDRDFIDKNKKRVWTKKRRKKQSTITRHINYRRWGNSRVNSKYLQHQFLNHKIIKIEQSAVDGVYDIEVQKYNNFALSAGVFVHNSQGFAIQGADVLVGILDEVDSPTAPITQKKRVLQAYDSTVRRFEHRFVVKGQSLGKLFVVSSKQDELSFIDTFITEKRASGKTLIFDYPLWIAKPKEHYSGKVFKLAVPSDSFNNPRIIDDSDVKKFVSDGYEVVDVPEEYYSSFVDDVIGATRDILGRSVRGARKYKFIKSEQFIKDCFDHTKLDPVKKETIQIGLKDEDELIWYLDVDKIRMPKSVPRYIHMDYGVSGDALGLSMCGVKGYIQCDVQLPDGTFQKQKVKIVETDFIMRILARDGDEIPTHKIRKFVIDLKQLGFNIAKFTGDLLLASRDTFQILENSGIKAEHLSVDKTDKPYLDWRDLIIEKRWVCHYHAYLLFEATHLEQPKPGAKVDHPDKVQEIQFLEKGGVTEVVMKGSKELTDSVAASCHACLQGEADSVDIGDITDAIKLVNKNKTAQVTGSTFYRDSSGKSIVSVSGNRLLDNMFDVYRTKDK